MSHQEYLDKCDEDQTHRLLEMCQTKLAQIKNEGWSYLWVVSDDNINLKWFAEGEYKKALSWMNHYCCTLNKVDKYFEIHLMVQKVRPSEVQEYLK